MGWIKTLSINTLLILGSLLIGLLFLELILFFTPYRNQILPQLEPWNYSVFNAERGYDIMPNYATSTFRFADGKLDVSSNSFGCFDAEFDGKEPYIYATGDSFTWGFAPLQDKWGKIVEREVGVRVLNCGVNGYGTRQELLKTEEVLEHLSTSSLIIVGYLAANDIEDDARFPNYTIGWGGQRVPNTSSTPEPASFSFIKKAKTVLSTQSVVYVLLRDKIYLPIRQSFVKKEPSPESVVTELPTVHQESIQAWKAFADEKGVQLLFVIIPSKEEVLGVHENAAKNTYTLLAELGIPYIDLLSEFQTYDASKIYWNHDGHWNIEGNHLAGELISSYIKEHALINHEE